MSRSMDSTNANDQLSARVRRTLKDMATIRQSLLSASDEPMNASSQQSQCLDLELAAELKSVVDALRLLLWAYIKALSAKSGRAPTEVLNWYKMELAVEMLRSASGRSALSEGCISGFEQLVNEPLAATPPKQRIQ